MRLDSGAFRLQNLILGQAASSNAESGDYSPTSTSVSFASGDTSKTFTVSTTNDSDRSDETVNIRFGSLPAAVGTGAQSTATLTINDTTPAPNNGGGGGGNGGGGNNFVPPSNNRLPNNEPEFPGASTSRSVAEKSAAGTAIGAPVTATDLDGHTLAYSLRGTDASSFDIDSGTGQIKVKADLDFEVKNTYSVSVRALDGRGGNDTIGVTINVTDVVEVPVIYPTTQVVVLVDPDEDTTADTPDDVVTTTIPEDTRTGPYFIRINSDACDWDSLADPPADELLACVEVEIFDSQGNPLTGDNVLDESISIVVDVNENDVDDGDTIEAFKESDEEWSDYSHTEAASRNGVIPVLIAGITGPGVFAIGKDAAGAVQQQVTRSVVPVSQLQ